MPLTATVESTLTSFVQSARDTLGDGLISIVLFGSAAEDRLRPTSDVNVVIVLRRFDAEKAAQLASAVALARAAIRLTPMFVMSTEIDECAAQFASKFADIVRRHRVLHGTNPFRGLSISREARVRELRQLLSGLTLRMRAQFVAASAQEDRFAPIIANVVGPLRVAAATLFELEGRPVPSPREALEQLATQMWGDAAKTHLASVTEARQQGGLPAGVGAITLAKLLELTAMLRTRSDQLA